MKTFTTTTTSPTTLSSSLLLLLLAASTPLHAHFLLDYPNTVGFDEDSEPMAPCGGFPVTFANATDFHVGGDAIALTSTHPASTWLYRATLDQAAAGNWSVLLPAVAQVTQGQFCEKDIIIPADFAGKKGVIQVVEDAVDGQLFQCAAVNFVAGRSTSLPSACQNATNIQASFTTDAVFSALATATGTGTSTGAMPSSSSSASGPALLGSAAGAFFWGGVVALGSVVAAFSL